MVFYFSVVSNRFAIDEILPQSISTFNEMSQSKAINASSTHSKETFITFLGDESETAKKEAPFSVFHIFCIWQVYILPLAALHRLKIVSA